MQALFELILRFITKRIVKGIKKKVLSPFKFVKNLIKDPKKTAIKKVSSPFWKTKSKIKKAKRLGHVGRLLISPKARAIEETYRNANFLTAIIEEENAMTAGKINKGREQSEISKEITTSKRVLKGHSTDEINNINKTILEELKGVGVNSLEDISRVIDDAEYREDLVKANGYDTYMDHWKTGFFGYAGEEQGLTKEEMDEIWEEILQDQTFEKFVEKKGL